MNPKIIAFYLPQYYPTETNNKWYGTGFTEWTNVGKAQKLFYNHYQPKIPADLGYYDLRLPEVRMAQAEMAKEAGIYGFCYYHYWFGGENGAYHTELDLPLKEVLRLKSPQFPFCLCWANQSWYSKFWNNDANCLPKLIAEQKYGDIEEQTAHFYNLLSAFQDSRYIRIKGKLLFMIYRPLEFPNLANFMNLWQELALKEKIGEFFFIGQATNDSDAKKILEMGCSGVNILRKDDYLNKFPYNTVFYTMYCKLIRLLGGAPYHVDYATASKYFYQQDGLEYKDPWVFPTILPNWDHSPRSGKRGSVFTNSTPENFQKHAEAVLAASVTKKCEQNLIFLKSWNEWGEGNYMEPDLRYGKGYIVKLADVVRKATKNF